MKPQMAPENVQLIDSQCFSTRTAPHTTDVVEAQFFIYAKGIDEPDESAYKLTAMTTDAFNAWSEERFAHGGTEDAEDIYPLVVSPALLSTRGLVEVVQDIWLNPEHPRDIALISQFLLYIEPTNANEEH